MVRLKNGKFLCRGRGCHTIYEAREAIDLRHTCGSLLIQAGVRPKDVQTILRHSKVSTTMDLYVHAFDEDLRGAVNTLDRALGS